LRRRVASSSAVGFPSRGGHSRGRWSGEGCQGFSPSQPGRRLFARHGSAHRAGPEAANSLRPSAGGARVGTAPRARDVAPSRRRAGLLSRHAWATEPGPSTSRAGLALWRRGSRAPSAEPLGSMSDRLVCRGLHRGMQGGLATRMHPEHPCCEGERSFDLVQANDLRPRWTTRLVGPRGLPRTRRQDASTPLLQPTFTSRALDIDTTSGDCMPGTVGNPAGVQLRGRLRRKVLPPPFRARRRTILRSSGLQRLRA
jgi:hypothetical protein